MPCPLCLKIKNPGFFPKPGSIKTIAAQYFFERVNGATYLGKSDCGQSFGGEKVEIPIDHCCLRRLIGNPNPSAADGVKQAVDCISVILAESALAQCPQSVTFSPSQIA